MFNAELIISAVIKLDKSIKNLKVQIFSQKYETNRHHVCAMMNMKLPTLTNVMKLQISI